VGALHPIAARGRSREKALRRARAAAECGSDSRRRCESPTLSVLVGVYRLAVFGATRKDGRKGSARVGSVGCPRRPLGLRELGLVFQFISSQERFRCRCPTAGYTDRANPNLQCNEALVVVDARTPSQFAQAHIPGSADLPQRRHASVKACGSVSSLNDR
jgi:hypothetical protein